MGLYHQFFIPCVPPKSTAQAGHIIMRRKDGTPFVGKTSGGASARAQRDLMLLFSEHRPPRALEGPVGMDVVFVWPWRKSEPKKNRLDGWRYNDKRPDVDNIIKTLLDIVTRLGWWSDDGRVASLTIQKKWGDSPGIYVEIWEMAQPDSIPKETDDGREKET